jgi:4'-phosphopantetheinyl transferase
LGPDELHVWHTQVPEFAAWLPWLPTVLSPDERDRAGRLQFDHLRTEFCTCRGLLRLLLERYGAGPAAAVSFVYTRQGKPALGPGQAHAQVEFNLAHSGGHAVFAFARGVAVGVDVETEREIEVDRLADAVLTSEEKAHYRSLPVGCRGRAFFGIWTRKEAVIKATGEGLGRRLDSFAVTTPCGPARFVQIDGAPGGVTGWWLADLTMEVGCPAAVAWPGGNRRVRIARLAPTRFSEFA